MGNSQSNPHEYTPEQYKQYLEYQEQQKRVHELQSNNTIPNNTIPNNTNYSSIGNNKQTQNIQYSQPNKTNMTNRTTSSQTQMHQSQSIPVVITKNNVNLEFNNQQKTRTQIKPEITLENKMIPDLQQKKFMPSVENNYQDAYQQRMFDNLSIGGKNMVSGATYTGKPNFNNFQNTGTQDNNITILNKKNISGTNTYNPIYNVSSNELDISNQYNNRELQFMRKEKEREMEFIRIQEKRMEEEHKRFKEEQNRRRTQFNEELSEVENLKYDPAQILGLDKNVKYDINEIKKAYRNLALKYHPDKGGSEEIFKILTKAYIALTKKCEKDNYKEKSFFDLKSQAQNNNYDIPSNLDEDEFDMKHFNSIFDEYKLENIETDSGYSDWMNNDNKDKPKVNKIFNQKFNLDIFNKVFDELKTEDEQSIKKNEQITVYKEPEILPIGAGLQYSDVDYNKIDDYSREFNVNDNSKGLFFTDYKKAHTNTTLINPNSVARRDQYKDVEELTLIREKQNFTMTDEEKKHIELKAKLEEEKEHQRLLRLKQRDEVLSSHSSKVNKLLLGKDISVPTRQLTYN